MSDKPRWLGQIRGRGNNIPKSHLERFGINKRPYARQGEPVDAALARFLKDQL